MRIVTGGCGFIGSNLMRAFAESSIVACSLDITGCPGSQRVDIENLDSLREPLANAKFVFHHAAMVSVPESVANPTKCHATNTTGTLNILVAARDAGIRRVSVASSSAVYGDDPSVPKVETMLPTPVSPYAASKLAAEELCRLFYHAYGVETVARRYFNVYGPGQSASSSYAAVIPKFVDTLVRGEAPVIYGDGEQTRDFVFVEDVVRANLLASEAPSVSGQVFNIGSGVQTSLNSLLRVIADILGVPARAEYRPERPGDVRHSVADVSKARALLGFEPQTTLEEGLRRTIAAYG